MSTIATTANGSATPLFSIGPDNGEGFAESADGHFSIDYDSGRVRIVYAVAPTATNDIKAGYKHRIVDAVPANEAGRGLPRVILPDSFLGATLVAADTKTVAYIGGRFRKADLVGYEDGYKNWFRSLKIDIQD